MPGGGLTGAGGAREFFRCISSISCRNASSSEDALFAGQGLVEYNSNSSVFLLSIGVRTLGTVAGDVELLVITIDGDDDVDGIGESDIGTNLASSASAAKGFLCSYGFPPQIMRSLLGDTCHLPGDMSDAQAAVSLSSPLSTNLLLTQSSISLSMSLSSCDLVGLMCGATNRGVAVIVGVGFS